MSTITFDIINAQDDKIRRMEQEITEVISDLGFVVQALDEATQATNDASLRRVLGVALDDIKFSKTELEKILE